DEMTAAVVVEQPRGDGAVDARAAVVTSARRVVAQLVGGSREIDVVGDEEIEPAVAVVIEEGRARAPPRIADARLAGDVAERPIAVVVEEHRRTERRDEQILIAVVVVVADRRAHPVEARSEAGTLGDVGEMERPPTIRPDGEIVAKESARGVGALAFGPAGARRAKAWGQRPALDQEHIEVAVVV